MKRVYLALAVAVSCGLIAGCGGGGSSGDDKEPETTIASFVGRWTGTFSGSINGSCNVQLFEAGQVNGQCNNNTNGGNFIVTGSINDQGEITFRGTGEDPVISMAFTGTLGATAGNGKWVDTPNVKAGTWSLTRQ